MISSNKSSISSSRNSSNDFGNNWVAKSISANWSSVSLSSTGQYQYALIQGGQIYYSSDFGNTWNQTTIDSKNWSSVSVSSSGQYVSAVENGGLIYLNNSTIIGATGMTGPTGPTGTNYWTQGQSGIYYSGTVIAGGFEGNSLNISSTIVYPTYVRPIGSEATPSIPFQNYSLGLFSINLSNNITGFNFTSPQVGGNYTIYVQNNTSNPYNIGPFTTGNTTLNNFPNGFITVLSNQYAVLYVTYYNSTYFMSGSVYS